MKSTLRISILSTIALLVFASSQASESVRITSDIANEKASFEVQPSGLIGAALNLDIPAIAINTVELDGNEYHEVLLPMAEKLVDGQIAVEGEPAIPVLSTFMAIPDQAGIEYTVEYSGFEIIDNIDLLPTQPSPLESGMGEVPFTINEDIYSKDEFYPQQIGEVGEPVIMRDVRMVRVSMYPVQYNPVKRQLKVYRDLSISVSFNGDNVVNPKTTRYEYLSDGFYPIYKAMISNFDQFFSTAEVKRGGYLILAKDGYVDALGELADWKRRKGYSVYIAPTSEIDSNGDSPTQSEVSTYIRNAYNNWDIPPEYVMIVGDESGYNSIPDYPYQGYTSDHKYSTADDNDYLPDMFVSRLSVASLYQLNIALAKILDYENNPYMDDMDHWRRGLSVAGNVYASTPRITVLWVRSLMLQNGFTHVDTSFGWYSGDTDPYLLGYFNSGPCMVSYRGWAVPSGWWSPTFNTSNLNSIQNHNMLAPMASIVCGTGNFGSNECFGEKWIRMGSSTTNYKGGPTFFGSTDGSTHTRWNNPIMTGYYWGIFTEGIHHFAAAAVRGKLQQYNTFPRVNGNGGTINKYFNTYNMLGDPELEIRTAPPTIINVVHPQRLDFGENYVAVSVVDNMGGAIEGAYVSILKTVDDNEELFEISKTDENGDVYLDFDAVTAGEIRITVSGRNLFPYQGVISVEENDVAIAFDSYAIDDDNIGRSSGNGDGIANPGEILELSVNLKNFGLNQTAENILAELSMVDFETGSVYEAQRSFGDIAPGESVESENPFIVRVNSNARDGQTMRFLINASDDQNSWESVAVLPIEAPKLVVTDVSFSDGNGRLDPGEVVEMILTIENMGSVDATGVSGVVSTMDDYTLIESAHGDFGDIPAGESGDNTASPMIVSCDDATFDGRMVNMNLHTTTASGAEYIVPFTVNVGLVVDSDPVGPDAYGYYMFDNTDTDYSSAPAYDWIEVVPNLGGEGTRLDYGYNRDDNSVIADLPFDFVYYGETYRELLVCINGFAALDTEPYDMGGNYWANFYNWPIPDPGNARGQISPFWDDLGFSGNTYGVYTWYDEENHQFVVEWYHMNNRNSGAIETFEMIISDPQYISTITGDSEILFFYKDITNNDYGEHYSSVGFESFDEMMGIEYTYDGYYADGAPNLGDYRAIKITTNTGRGAIGGNVELNNNGLNQGVLVSTASGQRRITPQSGEFWIREVPVGMTEITASAMGYFPVTISEVDVAANVTTMDIDFALERCPEPANLEASDGLDDHIMVTWDAVDHPDLTGYNVYRGGWENSVFERLNTEPVSGESYSDYGVPTSDIYWYYITAVFSGDYGDTESFASNMDSGSLENPTGVDDGQPSIPSEFFVSQNYPNPFNPSTNISYGLAIDADVRIEIFNVLGQNVRTLVDNHQTAGYKSVIWDSKDDSGSRASSGVYFYTIEAGDFQASKKMLLVK